MQYNIDLSEIKIKTEENIIEFIEKINEFCANYKLLYEIDIETKSIHILNALKKAKTKSMLNKEAKLFKTHNGRVTFNWDENDFIFILNYNFFNNSSIQNIKNTLKELKAKVIKKNDILVIKPSFLTSTLNTVNKAFLKAANQGDIDEMKKALTDGADIDTTDKSGFSALIAVSFYGYIDVIQFLLDEGADIEATNRVGYTPLIWAAANNQVDACELLLEHGADPYAETKRGQKAEDLGNYKIKKLIAEFEGLHEKKTPLNTKK